MEPLLNLRDLLQHEIDDLYSAEEQIIEAMPAMAEKATNRQLKAGLNEHLRVTKEQKKRLDKVKSLLQSNQEGERDKSFLSGIFGTDTKCKGVEGLIKEGEKLMGEDMDPQVMDAAIIAAAQKIEHYEISGYGTARAFAAGLGLREVAKLLQTTLDEEYKSDNMLTELALNKVNVEAEDGGANTEMRSNSGRGNGQNGNTGSRSTSSRSGSANKKAAPKKAAQKSVTKKSSGAKKATSVKLSVK